MFSCMLFMRLYKLAISYISDFHFHESKKNYCPIMNSISVDLSKFYSGYCLRPTSRPVSDRGLFYIIILESALSKESFYFALRKLYLIYIFGDTVIPPIIR